MVCGGPLVKLVLVFLITSTVCVRAQFGGGGFDDEEAEAMMRGEEGMPPTDGPREKVVVGVLHRPATCAKKVALGSRVAVDLTLSAMMPSETKPGVMEKIEVLPKKKKLIVAGSGRFIEGVEDGIIGACVGEKRSLRIPASLAFAEEGSKKLRIPPETDLRAVVFVEDLEEPDPYGEGMDEMSPDEDMDDESAGRGDGGEAEDEDEDDNEMYTGPHIPEEEFFAHVPKVTGAQLKELTETHKKNAFVMFFAPWCGHCTAVKPKFAKVARAFRGESSKVAVVAVDATEEEALAEAFGVEGFPTFMFVPAVGAPTQYKEARTTTAMVRALNDAFGTDRLANGRLTMMAGTVADLNDHVHHWQQGVLSLEELSSKLPGGSYYKRVVESIASHGKPYIAKEKGRLEKMMTNGGHSVKADQFDSMQRRYNILNVFDDERAPIEDGM
jgi:protein disulfide-isomerase-like protein